MADTRVLTNKNSKTCYRCKVVQPFENFSKNRTRKDGLHGECKKCQAAYEKMRTRRRYQPITIGTKNCNKCNIKKHVTQYSCDSKKSDGRMNICKECVSEKDKTIHYKPSEIDNLKCLQCNKIKTIDHFYNYGHTRGILCSKCNRGLGHFKDNIELLQEAINYLEGKV